VALPYLFQAPVLGETHREELADQLRPVVLGVVMVIVRCQRIIALTNTVRENSRYTGKYRGEIPCEQAVLGNSTTTVALVTLYSTFPRT
jgi:hypothetical protein